MERTIRLSGSLEEEHRQRLLQIAERCPVHRTLSGQLVIHTHLQA
jgi:putative redox protein